MLASLITVLILLAFTGSASSQSTNLRNSAVSDAVATAVATSTSTSASALNVQVADISLLNHKGTPRRDNPKDAPTNGEVLKALSDWGAGLVSINTAKENGGDYKAVAKAMIKAAYNYDEGIVLFKPTIAAAIPFRTTFEGALSYFVGGDPNFPEDTGFATKGWKSVSFEVVGIVYDTNRAIVQTKTTLTKTDNTGVLAYFSMSFTRKSKKDKLKLDLHHSSLPPTV